VTRPQARLSEAHGEPTRHGEPATKEKASKDFRKTGPRRSEQ